MLEKDGRENSTASVCVTLSEGVPENNTIVVSVLFKAKSAEGTKYSPVGPLHVYMATLLAVCMHACALHVAFTLYCTS